uniref:Uncharacterized protein n=1 Tax=Plectus sambesii TaxID=2011161 RepID=A0A914WKX1_9BILA
MGRDQPPAPPSSAAQLRGGGSGGDHRLIGDYFHHKHAHRLCPSSTLIGATGRRCAHRRRAGRSLSTESRPLGGEARRMGDSLIDALIVCAATRVSWRFAAEIRRAT